MLKLYNTLTRKKEEFVPLDSKKVTMYSCGPTVYGYAHIGNMRTYIFMDLIRRVLRYDGYKIKGVMNITDVGHLMADSDDGEDKMEKAAKEQQKSPYEIAEHYTKAFFEDLERLNIGRPEIIAKATEHIPEMIDFVKELQNKGYGYETSDGIYYDIAKFPGYGKLSGAKLDEQKAGARVEVNPEKHNAADFAIWKKAEKGHIMQWPSPWGMGYPGWHIECSAMAKKHLGDTIDIHAGGQDLQFPHHENEIAQSECCNGVPFAHYWMHNGYITIDNEKMSKSKGNFFTVRDILKDYSGEVMRFFLLSGHYRSPINFSDSLMEQAKAGLGRMENCRENLNHLIAAGDEGDMTATEKEKLSGYEKYREEFISAMDDDLNTADAISAVFELVTAINTAVKDGATKEFAKASLDTLMEFADVLGLLQTEEDNAVDEEIQKLVDERQEARKAKNFARADEIRDLLKERGIILKDTPQGVQIIKE